MQVTETLSEGLKRAYTVVVPAEAIEGRRTAKLTEIGRTIKLPGFRPGKVPMPVMKQRYGSAVMAEVLEESVNEATNQVLNERGLRPAMQPRVTPMGLDPATGGKATDLEFKVELELLPEIVLPNFSAIQLTRLKGEVPAETIDTAMNELATRQRTMEDVEEARPAEAGDFLKVDFLGTVDGVAFAGGAATDMDVEVAGPGFIPNFTEQLVGMSAGETRTIDCTFPEGYHAPEMAGKAAQFAVTAKGLRRAILPPVDDELAKQLGFDGIDEVRQLLTRQNQREYDQLSRLRLKRELLDALAKLARFEVPETMVEAEFDQIWKRIEADRAEGKLDEEDQGKSDEQLRTEYRSIAERRVRLGLLLAEIGRANGIVVGADEMNRAIRAEASKYQGQEQMVLDFFRKNPQAADQLRGPIFEDKVVDYLIELAEVTERPATLEELQAEPPVEV